MKRGVILIFCIVVSATIAYLISQQFINQSEEDQLTWLRREFHLTAEQTTAIHQLQTAYAPICAEHCRLIQQATNRASIPPTEIAQLEQICHDATLKHLREIAAVMPATEGRRFLALVEPKVSRHGHHGLLDLK